VVEKKTEFGNSLNEMRSDRDKYRYGPYSKKIYSEKQTTKGEGCTLRGRASHY